jgi:hypothetical protein
MASAHSIEQPNRSTASSRIRFGRVWEITLSASISRSFETMGIMRFCHFAAILFSKMYSDVTCFLQKNAWGQKTIRFYYRTNLYRFGLIHPVILLVAAIIAARIGWVLLKRMKKRPSQTTQINVPKSEFGKPLTGPSHFAKP